MFLEAYSYPVETKAYMCFISYPQQPQQVSLPHPMSASVWVLSFTQP